MALYGAPRRAVGAAHRAHARLAGAEGGGRAGRRLEGRGRASQNRSHSKTGSGDRKPGVKRGLQACGQRALTSAMFVMS